MVNRVFQQLNLGLFSPYRILPSTISLPQPHELSLQKLLVQTTSTSCPPWLTDPSQSIHLYHLCSPHRLLSADPENHLSCSWCLDTSQVLMSTGHSTLKGNSLLTLEFLTHINFQPLLDHQGTLLFNENHLKLSLKTHIAIYLPKRYASLKCAASMFQE